MTLCSKYRLIESKPYRKWASVCLLPLAFNLEAANGRYQAHQEIYAVARSFLQQQYTPEQEIAIKLGKLDQRLRLTDCGQNLSAFHPQGSNKLGKVSIGVSCDAAPGWRIYLSAYIHEFKSLYTLKHAVQRGNALTSADLQLEKRELSTARNGYITELSPYKGYIYKKNFNTGDILSAKYLAPPKLVKRGNKVTLLARSDGIEVRMQGKAMSDGAVGDIIKVRNLSSKKIVDAKVIAENLALVYM